MAHKSRSASGSLMTSRPGSGAACFPAYGDQVQMGHIQFQLCVSLAARDQGAVRQVYEFTHLEVTLLIK